MVETADSSGIKIALVDFSAGTATDAGVTTDCGITEGERSVVETADSSVTKVAVIGFSAGTAIGDSDGGIATDSGMLVA